MLLRHLNKPLFSSDNDSNLKSWSSSLIFVIRYAVWRAAKRGVAASEVQICVVDTTKFPPAQFVRDKWLLRAYKDLPMTRHESDFVDLRLNEAYNNGEFLSQGRVDVTGRSAVFALADLEGHGLSELYPELFAPPSQNGGWTKRVKTLRSEWSKLCLTPRKDIDNALRVADLCFGDAFDQTEIVLLLMAFKERWLNGPNNMEETVLPDEPIEVRRFVDRETKFTRRTRGRPLADELGDFFRASAHPDA
ncbi:hypothetical protein B0T11DRAFT_280321 [Plectosphaerella cucumerina]|uniref:Uncharacterized protein n=1 Tax=Plectosphaerella cucumerina TaxID=40658 RepID=A0A8K0X4W5_9PEZI|nr:hypothetical protein B0T11DRAFT_280321 [Plectosphaerella cucumerina]